MDGDVYGGIKWWGVSGFNIPHSFHTSVVYDLPGRNWSGAGGALLGGWSISGNARLTSGPPGHITAATPRNGSRTLQFTGGSTIDLIPGGDNNPVHDEMPTHSSGGVVYFDASQFSYPEFCFNTTASPNRCNGPSYVVQGNLGRNTLLMPGVANVDFSLTKNTRIGVLGENGEMQFRVQFFNLFNRVNYGNPSLSVFDNQGNVSPTVGRITSTRIPARQVQLGLRFVF